MFMNGQMPQLGGGLVLAGTVYALVSMFFTGPMIAERMVERLEWAANCPRLVASEVAASQPVAPITPRLGCDDVFGTLFGQEGADFCAYYGDVLENNPLTKSAEAFDQAQRDAQSMRRDMAVSRASTRCECAVTTTLEDRRIPLAIYAGSARLVTPPSVKMLASDLEVNLNSPACSMEG